MQLRPYQEELIRKIKSEIKNGKKSICTVLGCGGGKSVIEAMIAKSAAGKGKRILFLVHRKELCEQINDTFVNCGVDMDLCEIGMVQTVTRKVDSIPPPDIIITDEAHHCLAASYTGIYDYFPDAVRLGFTATPIRMNEGGLGKIFDSLVEGVSTKWLIENNYLSPYKYYSVKLADTEGLSTVRGDYDSVEIAELMESKYIYGKTIENYRRIADGKKSIVYCASVEASKETAQSFLSDGISAVHLDGETPKAERTEAVKAFRENKIQILCNVDLFGEGFDVPDCECVILLRPTKSLTLYIQQSMRSMRYKENKTALIIDHVGNVFIHGFPDAEREWSLEEKKKITSGEVRVKECPHCYACMPLSVSECPDCGYVFNAGSGAGKITVDAELEEITQMSILKSQPYTYYHNITTFEDMLAFGKAKNYKFWWTLYRCAELNIPVPVKYQTKLDYIVGSAR